MGDEFPKRITKWADVEALIDDGRLTPAELTLIEAAKAGNWALFSDQVPETKSDDVLIRAPLIRYLALGGCDGCVVQAEGVQVVGAWIEGGVDLKFAKAKGPLVLFNCHIADQPMLLQCEIPAIFLNGSKLLAGLNAQGALITGHVLMRKVISDGEINLSGATIGGQLSFEGATLRNEGGDALYAQRVNAKEGFYWRTVEEIKGSVDLTSAHVGDLADDALSWANCDRLSVAYFSYDNLDTSVSITHRLTWLRKGAVFAGDFHPQPYEQLAKVLRESGHRADAREVLVEKERHQLAFRRDSAYAETAGRSKKSAFGNFFRDCMLWARLITGHTFDVVAGYGHKPYLAIRALAVLILITSALAFFTWRAGDFAPNNGPILISSDWIAYAQTADNPAEDWADKSPSGRDYETFNALAYGADIVIPLISFGQESAWAPSTTRSWWGWNLLWIEWVMTLLGWIVTAIGAAAVTGVIRKE